MSRLLGMMVVVAVGGCGKGGAAPPDGGDAGPGLAGLVDQAAALWQATKATCSSYHYDRQLPLVTPEPGGSPITTVQIVDDVPVLRWFVSSPLAPAPVAWQEAAGEIGIHPDGYPAETMEELLAECRMTLENGPTISGSSGFSPGTYDLETHFSDRGVPLTCLATLRNCPEACSSGISLAGFSCGVLLIGSADGGGG